LPADGRRGGELSAAADWCDVPWPEGFADDLANLCAIRRTTPFAVLLTGYAAVLARLSGQDDVLVAAPVANRGRVDLEQVVGCFLNTLPLRVRIRANSTFAELLAEVDELLLDAHANSAVPFDRVVAALEHARGEVRSALFQSLLVVQNTPPWWAADEHRSVRVVELPGPRTHYDLKFEVFTQHPGLPARLVHASTVFGPERARRLAAQFAGFLGHAVADPHRMLAAYPLTDVPTVIPVTQERR
jgi:non-ribosomal peptide synthetase component F